MVAVNDAPTAKKMKSRRPIASAAMAQEDEQRHEVSAQDIGFFTKDSQGNGIDQHSTDTGGFLVGYRFYFNRWLGADARQSVYSSEIPASGLKSRFLTLSSAPWFASGEIEFSGPDTGFFSKVKGKYAQLWS